MRYALLGPTGLRVSELFLGAMGFGRGGTSAAESRRILDAYADAGGNVVDTAVTYRGGESEAILGELLDGRRDRFVVATKYTMTRDGSDPNAAGNHRKSLVRALDTSLRRLRMDHIDLYWTHVWDPDTPLEETLRALDDAVRAGKVLYAGFSDAPAWVVARADALAAAHGWSAPAAIQVPYSVARRDVERELLPMAAALGLSVAAWSPLDHGKLLPGRAETPAQRAVAEVLGAVAGELGTTPARVALAWTRARWPRVHPIVGASRPEQLADSLGAVALTLPPDAVERLDAATGFAPGFPSEFLSRHRDVVYGEVDARVLRRACAACARP